MGLLLQNDVAYEAKYSDVMLAIIHPWAFTLITFLALASLGGLTLFLAALEDVVSLFTMHLRFCDIMTRGICRWQLASLSGLWNLFRGELAREPLSETIQADSPGRRWNVLRQRTDSYQYDVDQLFLGTLLFTVSAFLFPTVLTYASLFFLVSLSYLDADPSGSS